MGSPVNHSAGCANFDRKAAACDGVGNGMATGHALAIKRMYGPGIILVAAKHNLREIAAEIGTGSHIDAARIRHNFNLRGPNTAAGVAQLAKSLLDAAGVVDFRKTAVRALELLFTLPAGSTINPGEYFERATCWAEQHFGVPVLSSLVHLDESAPHCHVLLLPLVNGKMNGSDLHGGKAKLWAMQASFHEEVSVKYGFARQAPKKRLSAAARAAGMARLRECFQNNTVISDHAISVLLKPHAKDPESLLLALGLEMPSSQSTGKSFVDIMTAPCKPEPRNYSKGKISGTPESNVEIEQQMGSYPYTCVGKGFAMDLDCDDSEHYQLVLAPVKSSQQDEQSTYAADSLTPTNRNSAHHGKTLVPASNPSHPILCGKAPENAPGIETTLTCASDQPAKVGRFDVPAFTTSIASKHIKRQGLHAAGSHRQWVPDTAEPTNKTNSEPLGLQPTFYARGGVHDRYSTPSDDGADELQFQLHGTL